MDIDGAMTCGMPLAPTWIAKVKSGRGYHTLESRHVGTSAPHIKAVLHEIQHVLDNLYPTVIVGPKSKNEHRKILLALKKLDSHP